MRAEEPYSMSETGHRSAGPSAAPSMITGIMTARSWRRPARTMTIMSHGHGARSRPCSGEFRPAFAIGIGLNTALVVAEAVYGYLGNSTALMADAGHNLSDVSAWSWPGPRQSPRSGRPVAFHLRSEGGVDLAALRTPCFFSSRPAPSDGNRYRLYEPEPVAGLTVMVVAAIGIVVNGATAMLRRRRFGRRRGVSSAHPLDRLALAGSRNEPGHLRRHPVEHMEPSARLGRDVIERGTAGTDMEAVRSFLLQRPGVAKIHDLHIWPISTTETAITCHLVMPTGPSRRRFLMESPAAPDRAQDRTRNPADRDRREQCVALAPDDVV
ncbi:hypothetical protein Lal_00013072 [Lupinus albus]|nr:hypothetical protein Lal_00013072 [Lupinus albus]